MISTSQYLITTKARPRLCERCGEPILAGVSEGLHVQVDIYDTPAHLEICAILAGRGTYSLHEGGLVARQGNSGVSGKVLVSHVCGYILRTASPVATPPQSFVPPF